MLAAERHPNRLQRPLEGGPPNNGQRLSWLIGPASSMAGLAQTAQQWSVRAARSVCGWYHCTPLGGVRKVRTQEKMYTYLYRLGDRWVRKLERIAQPRSVRIGRQRKLKYELVQP